MAKITFKGRNASGYVEYFGHRFETDKAVSVSDEAAIRKLKRHPEFEVGEGPKSAARAEGSDLDGKNKAELLEIAADEDVVIEEGATNKQIREAIEAARDQKGN